MARDSLWPWTMSDIGIDIVDGFNFICIPWLSISHLVGWKFSNEVFSHIYTHIHTNFLHAVSSFLHSIKIG